jgi:agmatine deiminase
MTKKIAADFPSGLGYRMPAEWEPQQATWLAWPHNRTDWPGKFEPIPYVYAEIVRHLAAGTRVELIVNDAKAEAQARTLLTHAHVLPGNALPDNALPANALPNSALPNPEPNIRFHHWPTNRGWLRDSGPIFVKDKAGSVALTNWKFNAWAKYKNWQLDNTIPQKIADLRGGKSFEATVEVSGNPRQMVLEGGSIDVNGRGLLLTTEECLLSPVQQRNPGMTQPQIEATLCRMLGVKKVLWLARGIVGDDTHGHVDDIARFVGPRTVLAATEPDPSDENHAILNENLRRLKKMTDTTGKALEIIPLPMPAPVIFKGQRVPASYANFYISNRTVLVPTFDDPNDLKALNIIERALGQTLPRLRVVPIYCGDLIWGLGAIHCMTQQEPLASNRELHAG